MNRVIKYIFVFGVTLLTISGGMQKACSQEYNYKINAAYIYNFTKYIEWPQQITQSGPFVIGIIGTSDVYDELKKVSAQRKVGNQPIEIRNITIEDVGFCHVVVVANSASKSIKQIFESTKGKPILIITEKEGAAYKSACISLFLDEDNDYKTKFQLNREIIESRQMKVSSQLTTLAVMVK